LGPALGLALLNAGYWLVALTSAGLWLLAASLFSLLRRAPRVPAGRGAVAGVRTALRDRVFMGFVAVSMPAMLLVDQAAVVVPLGGADPGAVTVFACVVAMVSAAVQPWCAAGSRAERPGVLRAGLLFAGGGHLLLAAGAAGRPAGLVAAAVLHGLASGLLQPAVFQTIARHARPPRYGTYLGVRAFFAGLLAFAGGAAVSRAFEAGPRGATAALLVLALIACAAAAAARSLPVAHAGPPHGTGNAARATRPDRPPAARGGGALTSAAPSRASGAAGPVVRGGRPAAPCRSPCAAAAPARRGRVRRVPAGRSRRPATGAGRGGGRSRRRAPAARGRRGRPAPRIRRRRAAGPR